MARTYISMPITACVMYIGPYIIIVNARPLRTRPADERRIQAEWSGGIAQLQLRPENGQWNGMDAPERIINVYIWRNNVLLIYIDELVPERVISGRLAYIYRECGVMRLPLALKFITA